MAQFDPYLNWLGIPPHDQPPNCYRLLGIALFEPSAEAIAAAAERQWHNLSGHQFGPQAEAAQYLIKELTAARACLLDPQSKADYDRQLGQTLAARSERAVAPPPPPVAPVYPAPFPAAAPTAGPAPVGNLPLPAPPMPVAMPAGAVPMPAAMPVPGAVPLAAPFAPLAAGQMPAQPVAAAVPMWPGSPTMAPTVFVPAAVAPLPYAPAPLVSAAVAPAPAGAAAAPPRRQLRPREIWPTTCSSLRPPATARCTSGSRRASPKRRP